MNIHENVAFLFSVFVLLHLLKESNAVGPCLFDADPRGVIDLTRVGNTDGTPKWKNFYPTVFDGHVYSYNPCQPFTQGSCAGVAGCQTYATDETLAYSLGTQNSIEWISSGSDAPPAINYMADGRKMHINLRCLPNQGDSDQLDVYGYDSSVQLYIMTLSSHCVCWNGCNSGPGPTTPVPPPGTTSRPGPKPSGTSFGTIVIILLVALIIVYLVAFMSFNKFKRHATGIEILPHRTFWISLPGYTFEGVRFIFRKATGKSGYSNV